MIAKYNLHELSDSTLILRLHQIIPNPNTILNHNPNPNPNSFRPSYSSYMMLYEITIGC